MHSRRVVSCPVQPRACHWSCVFWRDFSGVKRTCWTTGSWRSCLSLEVASSIPAGSTIIYRFLCGFICVSLCQSIKIKTNKYVYSEQYDQGVNCATVCRLYVCSEQYDQVVDCVTVCRLYVCSEQYDQGVNCVTVCRLYVCNERMSRV